MEQRIKKILTKYKTRLNGVSDVYFPGEIPEKKLNKAIKNHELEQE